MVAIRLLVAPLVRCALFGLFVAELVLSLLGALDLETTVTLCHMPSFGLVGETKKRRPKPNGCAVSGSSRLYISKGVDSVSLLLKRLQR